MAMIKKFIKVEARVNTYLAEHKGVSYREACLAVLDSSGGLGETKKEFNELTKDEILRVKRNIDNIVYDLSAVILKFYQVIADFILNHSGSKIKWN